VSLAARPPANRIFAAPLAGSRGIVHLAAVVRPPEVPPASLESVWGLDRTHEEVADRIAGYHELGIDEFILSGYPHLEEAYQVGEGVMPVLRKRGLLADSQ